MTNYLLKLRVLLSPVYWSAYQILVATPLEHLHRPSWRRRLLRSLKRRLEPTRKRKLDIFLNAFAALHPRARFVQIGSNDGVMEDPLRHSICTYPWRGVMVEPVPSIFARLSENYQDRSGLELFNVAISHDGTSLPFYFVDTSQEAGDVPEWAIGLGSFSKEMVLSHAKRFPEIAKFVVEIEVPCLSFSALIARSELDGIDLLHIDAEGYDWQILQTVDLSSVRPILIIYERHHLSAEDQTDCIQKLERHGYLVMHEGLDTFCFHPGQSPHGPALLKVWRTLSRVEKLYL